MHISVLLEESIKYLNLKEDSIVVDMTLGCAGHSTQILKKIKRGYLFAFEQDNNTVLASKLKLSKIGSNFEIINKNFITLKEELNKRNIKKVDSILFDLGVSSLQLDEKERGFSFHKDSKLDMRMDQRQKLSAYEVVNNYSFEELINIFYKYGEEKYSTSIAKNIILKRGIKPIETTLELVNIIKEVLPEKYKRKKHPARKIFQAIRIEVNNELEVFEKALLDALDMLKINGRICVITFHSLEDEICKRIFKKVAEINEFLKELPIIPKQYQPNFNIIGQFKPTKDEVKNNKRSRSAKLRVIERVK